MTDDPLEVAKCDPQRIAPRFASFEGGDASQYFAFVDKLVLTQSNNFAEALMLCFFSHYVLNLENRKRKKGSKSTHLANLHIQNPFIPQTEHWNKLNLWQKVDKCSFNFNWSYPRLINKFNRMMKCTRPTVAMSNMHMGLGTRYIMTIIVSVHVVSLLFKDFLHYHRGLNPRHNPAPSSLKHLLQTVTVPSSVTPTAPTIPSILVTTVTQVIPATAVRTQVCRWMKYCDFDVAPYS